MDNATPSSDFVQRFLFEELDIRGALVRLSGSWKKMQEGRGYPAPVQRTLGELATTTVLIGGNLRSPGRVTLQAQGDGPVPLMVVDCTERMRFRGVARFQTDVPNVGMPGLMGNGQVMLTVESLDAVRPYQTFVPMNGESLAEAFEHFIAQSEQQDSRLLLSTSPDCSAALLLQKLPDADARDPDGWARITRIAATLTAQELQSVPMRVLLPRLFPDQSVRLFEPQAVAYECPRDREKITAMLRSLGREECEAVLRQHGEILVADDICNYTYRFDHEDIDDLFGEAIAGARILH